VRSDAGVPHHDQPSPLPQRRASGTIAGMSCDDYEIKEEKAALMRACITTALGEFAFPISGRGMMGGRGSATPGWGRAFGDKPGFPLKVWSSDGKIAMQVTAIDKSPVPESAFAIPEGYVTMPGRGGFPERRPAPRRSLTAALPMAQLCPSSCCSGRSSEYSTEAAARKAATAAALGLSTQHNVTV